jgi:predicted DNA binding CopG/RHH family protein
MPKRKQLKAIPRFNSEAEERAFWEEHDTTDYVDWSRARAGIFPNLKPSTESISLRLPLGLLAELKILANKRDIPYQSLLKVFLAERIAREMAMDSGAMSNKRRQPSGRKPTPAKPQR